MRAFLLTNLIEKDSHIGWKVNLDGLDDGAEIQKFPEYLKDATYKGPTMFVLGEKSPYMK